MSPQETIADVQGASAVNDLLAGIGNNPEFAGFATETTVNAEAELVLA